MTLPTKSVSVIVNRTVGAGGREERVDESDEKVLGVLAGARQVMEEGEQGLFSLGDWRVFLASLRPGRRVAGERA